MTDEFYCPFMIPSYIRGKYVCKRYSHDQMNKGSFINCKHDKFLTCHNYKNMKLKLGVKPT